MPTDFQRETSIFNSDLPSTPSIQRSSCACLPSLLHEKERRSQERLSVPRLLMPMSQWLISAQSSLPSGTPDLGHTPQLTDSISPLAGVLSPQAGPQQARVTNRPSTNYFLTTLGKSCYTQKALCLFKMCWCLLESGQNNMMPWSYQEMFYFAGIKGLWRSKSITQWQSLFNHKPLVA